MSQQQKLDPKTGKSAQRPVYIETKEDKENYRIGYRRIFGEKRGHDKAGRYYSVKDENGEFISVHEDEYRTKYRPKHVFVPLIKDGSKSFEVIEHKIDSRTHAPRMTRTDVKGVYI